MMIFWMLEETSAEESAINEVTYSDGGIATGMRERADSAPIAVRTTAGEGGALIALCSSRVNAKRNRVEVRKIT
jgi:hypothetical protein